MFQIHYFKCINRTIFHTIKPFASSSSIHANTLFMFVVQKDILYAAQIIICLLFVLFCFSFFIFKQKANENKIKKPEDRQEWTWYRAEQTFKDWKCICESVGKRTWAKCDTKKKRDWGKKAECNDTNKNRECKLYTIWTTISL